MEAGKVAAIVTGGAVVATKAATATLGYIGFTGSGVAAGSFAAATQAGIGNVVAGSTFAGLQSLGALGGFAITGPVGIAGAALSGLGCLYFKCFR